MCDLKQNDSWAIIEAYFKDYHLQRLVRHQVDSYNYFVNYQMQNTIDMFNPIKIRSENDFNSDTNSYSLELEINLKNMKLHRPQIHENNGATSIMLPQDARLRNFTYSSVITVDFHITIFIRDSLNRVRTINSEIQNVHIGKMPIMLKSSICCLTQNKHLSYKITNECKYDPGGYFIINGSEKTVLGQERVAENSIFCFPVKQTTKWSWNAEIKSVPDFKQISPKQINLMISTKNNGFGYGIYVQLARFKSPIPLFIVFRAIGVISDKAIVHKIILSIDDNSNDLLKAIQASVVDSNSILTQEDAMQYLINISMYTPVNMSPEEGKKLLVQLPS